jgi:hypothetical protein
MGWQRSHAARGLRLSKLRSSSPTWNGGERIIILYVPTHRYEWSSYSPESEVADVWHNATDSALQRWQLGEPTDGGQRAKSFAILCRRWHASPCEREGSEKTPSDLAMGGLVEVKAGTSAGLEDQVPYLIPSNEKKTSPNYVHKGLANYPPCPMVAPH